MKVQENTSSYSAELEILDAIRCEGKEMKTRFLPDICPNKVAVYFQGAERLDTYLLPIIEGSCESLKIPCVAGGIVISRGYSFS